MQQLLGLAWPLGGFLLAHDNDSAVPPESVLTGYDIINSQPEGIKAGTESQSDCTLNSYSADA